MKPPDTSPRYMKATLKIFFSSKPNCTLAGLTGWKMTSWKLTLKRGFLYGTTKFSAHWGAIGGPICEGSAAGTVSASWQNQGVPWASGDTQTFVKTMPSNWPWLGTAFPYGSSINVQVGIKQGWQWNPGTLYTTGCLIATIPGFNEPDECYYYPN